jgi:molybdopterin converting factor small subunit
VESAAPTPALRVHVRLSGTLAQRLGARRAIDLEPGATVDDLVAVLARDAGFDAKTLRGLAVVAEGSFVARSRAVRDGEEYDVVVPVAGG